MKYEDEMEQAKLKLQLYGSYTRQLMELIREKDHLDMRIKEFSDYPPAAAKGYGSDKYHPAVEQMILDEASIPYQIKSVKKQREALLLDSFFEFLQEAEPENEQIIWLHYVRKQKLEEVGEAVGLSKSGTKDRIERTIDKYLINDQI